MSTYWQGFLPVSVWILFLRNLPQRRERLQQVAVLVLKLWKHVKVSNVLIFLKESCYETSVDVRILSKWFRFNLTTWVPIGLFAGAEPLEIDMGSRSLPFCDLTRCSGISAWVHTDWGCWPSGFAGARKYEQVKEFKQNPSCEWISNVVSNVMLLVFYSLVECWKTIKRTCWSTSCMLSKRAETIKSQKTTTFQTMMLHEHLLAFVVFCLHGHTYFCSYADCDDWYRAAKILVFSWCMEYHKMSTVWQCFVANAASVWASNGIHRLPNFPSSFGQLLSHDPM